ncbi:PAS domain-containing protein [Candidatus Omnitrophota bacterium]
MDKPSYEELENKARDLEREIRKLKKIEKAHNHMLEKHINLESIINRSPAMVFLWPIQEGWPVEFVSDNVEQVLGYTAGDFISGEVSWPGITHSGDLQRLEKEVASYLEQGVIEFSQEYRLITKSGEIRWMRDQNTILTDSKGDVTHIQSIVLDITEIRNIEHALRESEEKYRNLVENINGVIYLVDKNGINTYISPSVEMLLGYKQSETIGKPFAQFIHPEDLTRIMKSFKNIQFGSFISNEYRIITKSGEIRWILTSTRPHFSGDQYVGVQGICSDITELKRIEEELKSAQKELEMKTKNLEETNIALKVLLKHQDSEKKALEKNVISSLKTLVTPYIEKMKHIVEEDEREKTYLTIIETNLAEITKPLIQPATEYYSKLTPTEIQIVNLLKEDKTTKEISMILYISETTVFFHRRNIREKLGIKNKKTNLRSYIQSLKS